MHPRIYRLLLLGCLLLLPDLAAAQTFTSGSTGADGAFAPACTPTPCTVTVTLPASGVFNFTTITIPSGVTVKFAPNATNTPAILLATGGVAIGGTLDVSGAAAGTWGRPGSGGPGGFAGGLGADGVTAPRGSAGGGPGGGGGGEGSGQAGGGAGFASAGAAGGTGGVGGAIYGGTALRPILGGSGGGGGGTSLGGGTGGGGGGGGGASGAILIASSTGIALGSSTSGAIRAAGGAGTVGTTWGGHGSGGAIRLIAPSISGDGALFAKRGNGLVSATEGDGRIRLEAATLSYNGSTYPLATTALPQPVFPPAGQPTLAITSVAGVAAPASPKGSYLTVPDVVLPAGTSSPVEVVLAASQVPLGTTILVTAKPQSGTATTATSSGLGGSLEGSTATASLALSLTQTSILTAQATIPLMASAGSGPLYAEGEEVTHVKVAAVFGGASTVTYLTRSGREVRVP